MTKNSVCNIEHQLCKSILSKSQSYLIDFDFDFIDGTTWLEFLTVLIM